MGFKCCDQKHCAYVVCIRCHMIFHKSCLMRMKGKVQHLDENCIVCCQNGNDASDDETRSLQETIKELKEDSENKVRHIEKLKENNEIVLREAEENEENLKKTVNEQWEQITALKSEISLLKCSKAAVSVSTQTCMAEKTSVHSQTVIFNFASRTTQTFTAKQTVSMQTLPIEVLSIATQTLGDSVALQNADWERVSVDGLTLEAELQMSNNFVDKTENLVCEDAKQVNVVELNVRRETGAFQKQQLGFLRRLQLIFESGTLENHEEAGSDHVLEDVLETPLPLPLNHGIGSPVPPPRTRHNPFNKPDNNSHQRSHSMRSNVNPGESRPSDSGSSPISKISISFWELHNSYGRPILKDLNMWKHEQKEKTDSDVGNLISF